MSDFFVVHDDALSTVSKSTFGTFFMAQKKDETDWMYVCKRQTFHNTEGCSGNALREMSILRFVKSNFSRCHFFCHLEDCWVDENYAYIIFENIPLDLDQFLQKTRWKKHKCHSTDTPIRILLQIVVAMEYFHTRFIHRDLKPSNILIDETTKHVKVTDFGCAREISTKHDRGKLMTLCTGSIAYKPPEILHLEILEKQTQASYDGSLWDMWSIGCIWWEIVYGMMYASFPSKEKIADALSSDRHLECMMQKYEYMETIKSMKVTRTLIVHDPRCRLNARQVREFLVSEDL